MSVIAGNPNIGAMHVQSRGVSGGASVRRTCFSRRLRAGAILVLLASAACANPLLYTQTFDDGLAGWTSLGTAAHEPSGGAVDDGGFMKTARDKTFPGQHRITPEAATILTGDLKGNVGTNKLTYSFHAKVIHPKGRRALGVAIESAPTWWQRSVARAGTEWTHATFRIDTDWTDEEAKANGWTRYGGANSWQEVCRKVTSQNFVCAGPIDASQQPFVTGFDSLTVSGGWPEDVRRDAKGNTMDSSPRYLDLVRTMLDNMIERGRDRYGERHTPLFAAILDQDTLACPPEVPRYAVDPVRLDPGRYENRCGEGGGNIYYDQALLKCLDLMTQLTGEGRYRNAALDALRFALNDAVDGKGFPAMGGHMYWHFREDRVEHQGELHELWNWPLAWELWWAADPQKMREYARLMWEWHVFDKKTGETNRHSDGKKGYAFTFTSASIMSQWACVAAQTELEPYRSWCAKVADYHWSGRHAKTNMFDSLGGRHSGAKFTTMQSTVARDWIVAGQRTGNEELVRWGRSILDAYAEHGYDIMTGLFYAALNVNGTPVGPDAERDLVTGDQSVPVGYLAMWQPHVAWQEEPLEMAQVYAWAAEHLDRDAYLPTAERFGRTLVHAWRERYRGCEAWSQFSELLKSTAIEYYKERGVLHSRRREGAEPDPCAMAPYRKGGYVYQAPFGMFADHYGRMVQFCLSMRRLTDDERWLWLAREVAGEGIKELWRGKLFVGHVMKKHYMATDHVGILLHALLQLEGALGRHDVDVRAFF